MFGFYALSLLSGFFEIAPFIFALRCEGVLPALVVALCYQLGNLTPCPLRLSKTAVRAAAVVGAIFLAAYSVAGFFPLLCAAVALLSAAIQSARGMAKSNASKPLKRFLRVAGFALGLFGAPLPLLVSGAAAAAVVCTGKSGAARGSLVLPPLNAVNAAMVLHQIHYFSYCYAAIAFTAAIAGNAAALGLFLAGWAVYISAARLYRRHALAHSFFFGHSLLVLLLLGMFFMPSMAFKAALWVLTGIGGTTEFCLARLSLERGGSPDGGTFAENAGHIIGVICSIVMYAITDDLLHTVLVSAAAALGAIGLMAVALGSRKIKYSGKDGGTDNGY
ncbi:MAG: hypothetical protein FWG46_04395 [Treponema sp.]|nr:hypothetical protein [Treponema sp.]